MFNRHAGKLGAFLIAIGLAACQSQAAVAPTQPPTIAAQPTSLPATPVPGKAAAPQPTAPPPTAEIKGIECKFAGTGATIAIGGQRLNFVCPQEGGNDVGLFGEIQLGDKGWAIQKTTILHDSSGFSAKSSVQVLIYQIMLDDGSVCAFAGTGATTSVGDQRLNFTCGQDGDYTVGLFGEVSVGDQGWEITRGEVAVTSNGPVSKNVMTFPITGLVVAAP